jgi:hypothetical protein
MYKLRLVGITERKIVREVPVIEEINTNISKLKIVANAKNNL